MAKPKKPKKAKGTNLIFIPPAGSGREIEYGDAESGMLLDRESVRLIYNALRAYKPTRKEYHVHAIELERFEEVLVVEYGEPYPDAN